MLVSTSGRSSIISPSKRIASHRLPETVNRLTGHTGVQHEEEKEDKNETIKPIVIFQ